MCQGHPEKVLEPNQGRTNRATTMQTEQTDNPTYEKWRAAHKAQELCRHTLRAQRPQRPHPLSNSPHPGEQNVRNSSLLHTRVQEGGETMIPQ